jgi:prepilin-type N-terminal cleavage/methylation domain-containing protein
MNNSSARRSACVGFTLIELLTVMTIIAILVGLLLVVIPTVKDMVNRAAAKDATGGIITAVATYYTDYGKYPLGDKKPDPNAPTDVLFGDATTSNQVLFDILRNVGPDFSTPNQYNPKGVAYMTSRVVADPKAPRNGFATEDAGTVKKHSFVDPWGNEYRVAIDADNDFHITNLPYSDFQGANAPLGNVVVFSIGKDGMLGRKGDGAYRTNGTNSDDVISWQ